MARILEIREICERALRKIGTYSIRDSGADAAELEEARYWLDMLMGHLAADLRTWWLVPDTAPLALTAGQQSYTLATVLPAGDPSASIISVASVALAAPNGREDVPIFRRWEWEARDATIVTGPPRAVYIDRSPDPKLLVWPTPSLPLTHRLEVVFQRVSPDLVSGPMTERVLKFRQAWNLYMVVALAAQIGNGPVRKLPGDEVRDMQMEADRLLFRLQSYDGHEQAGEPRIAAHNGI